MAENPTPPAEKSGGQAAAAAAQQQQMLPLDESRMVTAYANFCRIMGTPEEVILDFGLNPQAAGSPNQPIVVSERLVMNYYTAKRMLTALHVTIRNHEERFGVLEPDVRKRIKNPG